MLSAEMYDFLFTRAVQREVTFQAARAHGIELTDSQKERLAELRARSEAKPAGVFDTVGQNPQNTEFEQRDFTGLALQAVLAEKAGVPSPYVTSEQVEEYFQQHKSDYAQIPVDPAQRSSDAWAAVDSEIRKKLTPALQAEHDRQFNKMMADLQAKANVVVAAQE
jgi:DNA-binding MarR family transcriptional regulator